MEKANLAKSINEKIIETLRHAGVPEIITEQIDTIIYFIVILIIQVNTNLASKNGATQPEILQVYPGISTKMIIWF